MKDSELKRQVSGFQTRMQEILSETNGRPEPVWRR
jgi:hypothetical protein